MSCVVVGMEPDEVAVKDAQQQFVSDGEDPVDLTAGEGRVEEEPDLDVDLGISDLLPEHLGQQHQVVIMDPNQVAVAHLFRDGFGEKPVGFFVGLPGGFVKGDFAGVVVEERPQDGI